ncbi:unnamed protein product [Sphagnum compactum]
MVLENALVRGVVNSHLQVYCQTLQEHAQEFGVGGGGGVGGGSGVARISSGCKTRMSIYFSSSCVPEIKASTWNPLRISVVVPADRRLHTAAAMNQQEPFLAFDAPLESKAGISFDGLREKLAAGEWEAADAETRRLLCELSGDGAAKRKWVYFTEVQFIPEADLQVIDSLWRAYSNNKFGYSVQRKIWNNGKRNWNAFFKKVGWTRALDEYQDTYKKFPLEFMWDVADPTPEGHLPLTNALRGTQLLEKLLTHPAFADIDQQQKLQTDPDLLSGLFRKFH